MCSEESKEGGVYVSDIDKKWVTGMIHVRVGYKCVLWISRI